MLLPQGWLKGVKQIKSSNYDERPIGVVPEVIIVHAISLPPGKYGSSHIEDLFCNKLKLSEHPYFNGLRRLRVSAHFLIRRNGEIIQFVSTEKRAWHAGKSFCLNRDNVNDFSIGIELEGCDYDKFENDQYKSLNYIITLLRKIYPAIHADNIFGHSDIAPGRKTDPGPHFDWSRLELK